MIIIVVCLVVLVVFVLKQSNDPENLRKYQAAQEEAKSKAEESWKGSEPPQKKEPFIRNLDIPVEVLPNLYSLNISNVALKLHGTYIANSYKEYVSLKCKVNYRLNGRKEGKRSIVFTSYNDKDEVLEMHGQFDTYKFTEAGYEFVETSFNYDREPVSKISISVKEV